MIWTFKIPGLETGGQVEAPNSQVAAVKAMATCLMEEIHDGDWYLVELRMPDGELYEHRVRLGVEQQAKWQLVGKKAAKTESDGPKQKEAVQ